MDLAQINQALQEDSVNLGVMEEFRAMRPKFAIHLFQTLDSTNSELWRLLAAGAPAGTVVIAEQQTAGRGQWGRQWRSTDGGVYLSLAIEPELAATDSLQLTLCSAWGIAIALRNLGVPVRLKWPNDLVINGRKLGGVLTETRTGRAAITQAVIGVGVNWSNPTPDLGINLQTILAEYPAPALKHIERLAAVVLRGVLQGHQRCRQIGFEAFIAAYEALLVNIGQDVQVNGHSGVVVGVNTQGALRIRLSVEDTDLTTEVALPPGAITLGYNV
ncbi:MAG: biotin--[acetyl-CoA-carboxylase] ligase [Leptolyngbyaceae cyanobacterium MO_188.B28]|nr:biotin--[acetyl-CoA-carboxylase] ligase [Leptolyngbyaceae cyanobacterium MO_188.B28]